MLFIPRVSIFVNEKGLVSASLEPKKKPSTPFYVVEDFVVL